MVARMGDLLWMAHLLWGRYLLGCYWRALVHCLLVVHQWWLVRQQGETQRGCR